MRLSGLLGLNQVSSGTELSDMIFVVFAVVIVVMIRKFVITASNTKGSRVGDYFVQM